MSFKVPNEYRITTGPMASTPDIGRNGAFRWVLRNGRAVFVIASDGNLWEHVSVSMQTRCPTWEEMCMIKDLFWDADDCVIQYHPPRADYVNNAEFCLHLWRPTNQHIPRPPAWMVGLRTR